MQCPYLNGKVVLFGPPEKTFESPKKTFDVKTYEQERSNGKITKIKLESNIRKLEVYYRDIKFKQIN